MTIAVIWQEDGVQWCAADTRLTADPDNSPTTEIASKIYVIPVVTAALDPESERRLPHYWTQYGFVYAGAALPASMTAVTASTLLQNLVHAGGRVDPPTFEQIAELVYRLAKRFMVDRRRFGGDGIFQAAFFGWCPHATKYKIAHIEGRNDGGSFRVEISYPPPPQTDGDPWLILGSATPKFKSMLETYKNTEGYIRIRTPRRIIDKMVAEEADLTVGGATSIGAARPHGFGLYFAVEPIVPGQPAARAIFNGLDLATEIGTIGQYFVGINGLA